MTLSWYDWCPYKKREEHRGSMHTQEKTMERQKKEAPPKARASGKPNLLTPQSWTSNLRNEKINSF